MTKYKYEVTIAESNATIAITRNSDQAIKKFFVAGHTRPDELIQFMSSITDELAEAYFPKPKREKEQKNAT
jgi:chorismate mutase